MIRTGYSFRVAVGKLDDVMSRLVECEYPAAPICDRASMFGFVRWSKLSKKNNQKPVFGVELGVCDSLNAKKPIIDYWTFIAKDSLVPINKLFELATSQFHYEPLITYQQALDCDAFKIVGYRSNLDLVNPSDDLYVGLSPSVSKGYFNRAKEKGFRFLARSDNKFPRKDDKAFYEVVCGRGASVQTYDQHIQTKEEWMKSVGRVANVIECAKAIENRDTVLYISCASLKKGSMYIPEKPKTIRQMCIEGAERLKCDLSDPVYSARFEHELKMIEEKKFEDYFYIIADICQWARARMLVGPARGSSCGSLVCYLLGITLVDPIPYGLIFERFIDINRGGWRYNNFGKGFNDVPFSE